MAQKNEYRSITSRSHLFRDLIIIGSIFVLTFVVATQFDAFETVVEYVGQHEDWELDELITGVLILSAISFIYSVLRIVEADRVNEKLYQTQNELRNINEKLHVVGQLTRHDARNKLAIISNNIYLAKHTPQKNNDISQNLESIQKAVNQTEHIFDFAAVYEKLAIEKLTTIDVGSSVNEAATTLNLQNVELINECKGMPVIADSLLTRLFYNLMQNSLTHGKKLTQIKIYPKKTDNSAQIIYEDNGVGIPENEKEQIFTEGYGKGTGYGLFLIKKMCEAYNWTIKETGTPEKGARFEITVQHTQKTEKT